MSKKTRQEELEELERAWTHFKYEVAKLLLNNPRVLIFWLATWLIIRITIEWVR